MASATCEVFFYHPAQGLTLETSELTVKHVGQLLRIIQSCFKEWCLNDFEKKRHLAGNDYLIFYLGENAVAGKT